MDVPLSLSSLLPAPPPHSLPSAFLTPLRVPTSCHNRLMPGLPVSTTLLPSPPPRLILALPFTPRALHVYNIVRVTRPRPPSVNAPRSPSSAPPPAPPQVTDIARILSALPPRLDAAIEGLLDRIHAAIRHNAAAVGPPQVPECTC